MNKETKADIQKIINNLPPTDWEEIKIIAKLSPADRVKRGIEKSDKQRKAHQDKLRQKYPFLSEKEIKMKALAHFTSVILSENHPLNPERIDEKIAKIQRAK
ncbi:MAG: hypothetical protein B5M51_02995 [Anaerolinea sp. 4484_236]|nr:MAG: hypothetical protein B5M51_02995 [Anaerolinea sp. 4484_236]